MIREFVNVEFGSVRTTIINEEPYFGLVDVARMLNIENAHNCRKKIPSNEIVSVDIGNGRKMMFVTARQLSTCLFISSHPEAEDIYKWLFKRILPELAEYIKFQVEDFNEYKTMTEFLDEYQGLRVRNKVLEADRRINKTKLRFVNKLLGTSNCVDLENVHDAIKYPGISKQEVLRVLRYAKVLDDCNTPYQEFCDKKYFRVVEGKVITTGEVFITKRTFVYKKGVNFIERILKEYEVRNHA